MLVTFGKNTSYKNGKDGESLFLFATLRIALQI